MTRVTAGKQERGGNRSVKHGNLGPSVRHPPRNVSHRISYETQFRCLPTLVIRQIGQHCCRKRDLLHKIVMQAVRASAQPLVIAGKRSARRIAVPLTACSQHDCATSCADDRADVRSIATAAHRARNRHAARNTQPNIRIDRAAGEPSASTAMGRCGSDRRLVHAIFGDLPYRARAGRHHKNRTNYVRRRRLLRGIPPRKPRKAPVADHIVTFNATAIVQTSARRNRQAATRASHCNEGDSPWKCSSI
jgi:hypothetical protein